MTARLLDGGASALPVPRHPRRCQRQEAMGECSLAMLRREGKPIPPNVTRLFPPPEPEPVQRSPELVVLLAMFFAMPREQRQDALSKIEFWAEADPDKHFEGARAWLAGLPNLEGR